MQNTIAEIIVLNYSDAVYQYIRNDWQIFLQFSPKVNCWKIQLILAQLEKSILI